MMADSHVMAKTNRRKTRRATPASRAKVLKEALAKKGWKQCHVAKAMKVSPPTVSRWFTGKRAPDRDHIADLCELLDIRPELLL